jgi:DNA ligase (NAD+)
MKNEKQTQDNILIYESENGDIVVDVHFTENTLWLSLNQLSSLFGRDKSVISRHLANIFKNGELHRNSTVAFFATVQSEGDRDIERQIEYFNLDAILSVGYRVNSKQGTQFRRWASQILQDHLLKGYSINQQTLTAQKISELEQTIELFTQTLINQSLVTDLGSQVINLVRRYAKTWSTLLEYDEDRLIDFSPNIDKFLIDLKYEEITFAIKSLKDELIQKGEATDLVGLERGDALKAVLGNLSQTFDQTPLYPSNIDRAAHLLYFIIKDHPFSDGNKRIGCFLFLMFLEQADVNLSKMDNNSMIALALLIAESHPSQKEMMIKLVMRLIN